MGTYSISIANIPEFVVLFGDTNVTDALESRREMRLEYSNNYGYVRTQPLLLFVLLLTKITINYYYD